MRSFFELDVAFSNLLGGALSVAEVGVDAAAVDGGGVVGVAGASSLRRDARLPPVVDDMQTNFVVGRFTWR